MLVHNCGIEVGVPLHTNQGSSWPSQHAVDQADYRNIERDEIMDVLSLDDPAFVRPDDRVAVIYSAPSTPVEVVVNPETHAIISVTDDYRG